MAKPNFPTPQPGRTIPVEVSALDEILKELRAIRSALENPKTTAIKELRETIET
jgi:hypothetical protein